MVRIFARAVSVLAAAALASACDDTSSTNGPIPVGLGDASAFDAGASDSAVPLPDAAPEASASNDGATVGNFVPFTTVAIDAPQHLVADTNGNVFVANFTGGFTKLGPDGAVLGRHGQSGPGASQRSVGIALDAAGNVLVGDYGAHAVLKYDPSGNYLATFNAAPAGTSLGEVTGLAIDAAGVLYVADDDNGRIVKYDPTGAVIGQVSTTLAGGGALGTTALAFDTNGTDLWVTRYYDHVVARISGAGALIATYGAAGSGALGTFSQPYAIAKGNGRYYIADNGAGTVQALGSDGTFQWAVGSSSVAGGMQPTGVAVSWDGGKVFVSDGAGDRVLVRGL